MNRIRQAFARDAEGLPSMSLRGGNAVDSFEAIPEFDDAIDIPSDIYLERYAWGIDHLNPESYRYYLPYFMDYALRHGQRGSILIDCILQSLRPPDRVPARFATLSSEQEEAVCAFLEHMTLQDGPIWQSRARQVLEEYWAPEALYRG